MLSSISACSKKEDKPIENTDWEKMDLMAKVKSLKSTKYRFVKEAEEFETKGHSVRSVTFNDRGRIVENISYFNDKYFTKEKYKYDNQGNNIEVAYTDTSGSLQSKTTFEYDEEGNKIKTFYYRGDSLSSEETCWYDEKGHLLKLLSFDKSTTYYKYDKQGNKIEETCYSDSILMHNSFWKYDEKDTKLEEVYYSADTLQSRFTYKYDEQGRKLEELYYNPDSSLNAQTTYTYEEGLRIEETKDYGLDSVLQGHSISKVYEKDNLSEVSFYNTEGKLIETISQRFNDKGNLIEHRSVKFISSSRHTDTWTWLYEYDDKGNWIQKTELLNALPQTKTVREIVYY